MKVTVPALRDMRRRANECLGALEMLASLVKTPERWEQIENAAEIWQQKRQHAVNEARTFPGMGDILYLIETEGTPTTQEWPIGLLQTVASAHTWALLFGEILSHCDLADTSDPPLTAMIPSDEGGQYLFVFIFDDSFFSKVSEARTAIELEHRRAARFVMQQGGAIDLVVDDSPPGRDAKMGVEVREIIPELNPNEWELLSAAARLPNGGTNDELAAEAKLEITNGSVRPVIPSLKRQKLIDKKNRLTEWGRLVLDHHSSNGEKSAH